LVTVPNVSLYLRFCIRVIIILILLPVDNKISLFCCVLMHPTFLFVCVGPRKRVYCSLQAYCTYPMCVQCSDFHRQEASRHNDAGDPSSEKWNLLGEKLPVIWPKVGIFYMPQIYDMGQTALLPLRRKSC
jgi:hypothetical protein